MLFSVIIPVYNKKNYLLECIDSILQQPLCKQGEVEVVLIDDGSTDGSSQLCDELAEKHLQIIKVIHQKNSGSFLARRKGYACASGDYIVSCDADDKLSLDFFYEIKNILKNQRADIIFFNMFLWNGAECKKYFDNIFTKNEICQISINQVIQSLLLDEIPVVTSMACKVVKKECLNIDKDYLEYSNVSMGDDTIQSAELFKPGQKFYYLNKSLYFYRTGSGMTAKFDEKYWEKFKIVLEAIKKRNNVWKISDFDNWYYIKVINVACQSVTQSSYEKNITFKRRKQYLTKIAEDSLYQEAFLRSQTVSRYKNMKKRYKLINFLLYHKCYLLLDCILRLKSNIKD
jgi:glycosyltransferase involved in cell wall biosynthesis